MTVFKVSDDEKGEKKETSEIEEKNRMRKRKLRNLQSHSPPVEGNEKTLLCEGLGESDIFHHLLHFFRWGRGEERHDH